MKLSCTINGQPGEIDVPDIELAKLAQVKAGVRLTREDLKKRWGVCMRVVANRTRRIGRIKDGRTVRFPLAEVEAYEKKRTLNPRT